MLYGWICLDSNLCSCSSINFDKVLACSLLYDSSRAEHGNDDPCHATRLPIGTVRWKKQGLLQQQRASSEILSRVSSGMSNESKVPLLWHVMATRMFHACFLIFLMQEWVTPRFQMLEVFGIAGSKRNVEKNKCNKTLECISMERLNRRWNMVRAW